MAEHPYGESRNGVARRGGVVGRDGAISASPAVRAADAAVVMSAALRMGVGLPSGVERQSSEALDAVAASLVEGDGTDPAATVDALVAIVPAPARGIMRLALAGADVRRLLGVLGQIVAIDRRTRRETMLSLWYPVGICLMSVVGITALALFIEPSLNALAEPIAVAEPAPSPTPRPVWNAVAPPAFVAALVMLGCVVLWWSRSGQRAKAARRRAAVICELQAMFAELGIGPERQQVIIEDLAVVEGSATAGPVEPPLAAAVQRLPAGHQAAALRDVAYLYRQTIEQAGNTRRELVPVVGSLVAGCAVLLYGIALFVPLAQFFSRLASMPVAPPWSPGS